MNLQMPLPHHPEITLSRVSLRFSDTAVEQGYLRSHREEHIRSFRYGLAVVALLSAMACVLLIAITSGMPTVASDVATTLSWRRVWLYAAHCAISTVLFVIFCRDAVTRRINLQALEWISVIIVAVSMASVVATDTYYHARIWGIWGSPTAMYEFWGHHVICSESFVLLVIDGYVTASHFLLGTRVCRLIYIEMFGVVLYLVISSVYGSREGANNLVSAAILAAIIVATGLGKRNAELQDRVLFVEMVGEKSKRCKAEFALEQFGLTAGDQGCDTRQRGSAQSESSLPTTTATGRLFEALDDKDSPATNKAFQDLVELGRKEHWLLDPGDLIVRGTEVIGRGGFGIVFGGALCGAEVAVKFSAARNPLREREPPNLGHELRLIRQLRHPNIVLTLGAILNVESRSLGLVLERLHGKTLSSYVNSTVVDSLLGPWLSSIIVRQISLDVCRALWYLHTRPFKIVHGDLKGENVFVEECPHGVRSKILDFGLARLLGQRRQPCGGTWRWAPPEAVSSNCQLSPSADVYSFGNLVFFMATGTRPFQELKRADIMSMLKEKTPPPLQWPSACRHRLVYQPLVEACVDVEASKRPATKDVWYRLNALPEQGLAASGDISCPPAGARVESSCGTSSSYESSLIAHCWHRDMVPTRPDAVLRTLIETIAKWNFQATEPACCKFHGGIRFILGTCLRYTKAPCLFDMARPDMQCQGCGLLLSGSEGFQGLCQSCGPPAGRPLHDDLPTCDGCQLHL